MIRKAHYLFILLAIIIMSCSDQSDSDTIQDPAKIISKDQMIIILADMQIIEAHIDQLRKSGFPTKDSSMKYFEKVFKKHEITPEKFESSILFYKKDLNEMSQMYTDVITRLNELKAKNEELIIQMKEDSIKQDSLLQLEMISDSIKSQNDTIFATEKINSDTNNIIP